MLKDINLVNSIAIAIGAVPGALSRYYITEWCKKNFGTKFPYGTFFINISGCLVMGFFLTLNSEIKSFPVEVQLMLATGFLGAYTTFSTYGFDTLTLWRRGKVAASIFYWAGSAISGVISILIGVFMAQLVSL
jgi:CrcB protein